MGIADPVDPHDIEAGSGATASLLAALEEVVGETVAVNGELPPTVGRLAYLASVIARVRPGDLRDLRGAVRRAHTAAVLGAPTIALRSALVRRRLRAAAPLDGVVQRGSEMVLARSPRVVTYEDSTVVQALASYPWPHLRGLTERDIDRYVGRQRRVYEAAFACCCVSEWVAESIVGSYGIPPERVFVVGLGQVHASEQVADRDWSAPRYLFVGMDFERKNGPAVLRAFAHIRERIADARLDVVGGHPRLDLPGVTGHGRLALGDASDRARMAALYASATAFVMPSLHEPSGTVYIEAGGAGVPSIGTSNGGAATMIGPGGCVVDPLDGDAIVAAMLRLADPDTARQLGALAASHAALFTWRKVAERLIRAMAIPGVDTSGLAAFL